MNRSELLKLPACKERARIANSVYYFTGKDCVRGHQSPRYTSSGNCVQCIADKRNQPEIRSKGKPRVSEENTRRSRMALSSGETTYRPERPCKHGHLIRCVTTHNCVSCWKEEAERNKYLRRWNQIKKKYGLSKEGFFEILSAQDHACPICKSEVSEAKSHVDHCHSTGKVRGILCSRCNQAIGLFKEDIGAMVMAIRYLEHKK